MATSLASLVVQRLPLVSDHQGGAFQQRFVGSGVAQSSFPDTWRTYAEHMLYVALSGVDSDV
jgi:hypothetical protein